MKNVELIRARICRGMQNELIRLRGYISSVGGNEDIVPVLEGESGKAVLAVVTDCIMRELGHGTDLEADDAHSKARRAVGATRRRVD